MIQITLPDSSVREFATPVTVADVAVSIGAGLAKAALAGKVDGKVVDTFGSMTNPGNRSVVSAIEKSLAATN